MVLLRGTPLADGSSRAFDLAGAINRRGPRGVRSRGPQDQRPLKNPPLADYSPARIIELLTPNIREVVLESCPHLRHPLASGRWPRPRRSRPPSTERRRRVLCGIEAIALQVGKADDLERRLVRGRQHDARRGAGFECFLPALRTQAPAVARLEPRKAELGTRGRQVVAARIARRRGTRRSLRRRPCGLRHPPARSRSTPCGRSRSSASASRARGLAEDVALFARHGRLCEHRADSLFESGYDHFHLECNVPAAQSTPRAAFAQPGRGGISG